MSQMLTDYIIANRKPQEPFRPCKWIECKDGLRMSVQANQYAYCSPRDDVGPWYKFEIGFPSQKIDDIMEYIDGQDSDPTGTVYGYVPGEIIDKVIADHGGILEPK